MAFLELTKYNEKCGPYVAGKCEQQVSDLTIESFPFIFKRESLAFVIFTLKRWNFRFFFLGHLLLGIVQLIL